MRVPKGGAPIIDAAHRQKIQANHSPELISPFPLLVSVHLLFVHGPIDPYVAFLQLLCFPPLLLLLAARALLLLLLVCRTLAGLFLRCMYRPGTYR